MPTYVYQCKPCHFKMERKHKMSEDPIVYCPECYDEMSRVPQTAGISLKGDGFYRNDKGGEL